jgi:Flp pilus assembly protein TadG
MTMPTRPRLRRLIRNEQGAALVEFAILLPILLLLFATIIEGGRMIWSYQSAISGVRDAARYVGRIYPTNVCPPANTSTLDATLLTMVAGRVATPGTSGSLSALPAGVAVNSVTASFACVNGTNRVSPVPIVTVIARVTITFPFANLFELAGGSRPTLTTTITDQSRIFGS